jgi:hypothetical protein
VRRLVLIAIGLSALWIFAARTDAVSHVERTAMSATAACSLAAPDAPDTDQHWHARQSPVASVSESMWKSAPVHAGLASRRDVRSLEATRTGSSPDPPVDAAPHYLRHTPLLI